jgi:Rod binding domain-containing protein
VTPVAPAGPVASIAPRPNPAAATAEAFEAVLIGQMTQLMMATTGEAGAFSGGHGEEMFRGILAERIGTEIARSGGLGLAPAIMQQIIELQGTAK